MSRNTNSSIYTFFVSSFRGGGAERVFVNLIKEFVGRGLKVEVLVVSNEGPLRYELPTEVKVVGLKCKRIRYALWPLILYLRRQRPRVIYCAQHDASAVAALAKCLTCVDTKIIGSVHIDFKADSSDVSAPSKLIIFVLKLLHRKIDKLVCVSDSVAKSVEKAIGNSSNLAVIYNPVITPTLQTLASEEANHPWFAAKDKPLVISVGRLVPQKNPKLLITSFAQLRKAIDARLVILGDGPLRLELQNLIKDLSMDDCVAMMGFVSNPFKFLAKADLFVMTSQREGLANVLVEALFLGVPAVVTDCSGVREVLSQPTMGKVVPLGDKDLIASAMLEVLTNTFNCEGEPLNNGLERFKVDFSAQRYLDLAND